MIKKRLQSIGALLVLIGTSYGHAQEPAKPALKNIVPSAGAIYHSHWQHPNTGFRNPDGSDALVMHFPEKTSVNFADPKWHKTQIESMMETELDFMMPSFQFDPRRPKGTINTRNENGLKALCTAMTGIMKSGGNPPLVAMFLDTSFLASKDPTQKIDLRSAEGLATFRTPIFKFFDLLPKQLRYTMSDFPVIVVDTSHGVAHRRDFFDKIADAFLMRYQVRPWFVTEKSWNVRGTARWQKGAALHGPQDGNEIQSVGPGYDDTRIPDRGTPVRKREDTRFYQWSWNKVLFSNPTLVIIESWNDFSSGTGIADSQEYGTQYLDLTRRFIGRLKNRMLPDRKKPVRLANPDPVPRPDKGWWQVKGVKDRVFFVAKEHRSDFGYGLRLARADDGIFNRTKTAGTSTVTPTLSGKSQSYIYFGIADEFAYRIGGSYEVEVILHPATKGTLLLQYDSWDRSTPVTGAYKSTPSVEMLGTKDNKTRALFTLPDPRFGNRQNGGADFRLSFKGEPFAIIGIQARRLPKKIMTTKASASLR
jgi:hypothetical protein